MIIQIRGTSGSGKSTLMKRLKANLSPSWLPIGKVGRKRPLYYRSADPTKNLYILGHYETACGGCDTIGSARAVFELIQDIQRTLEGQKVWATILCEGLLLSEDTKWSSQLHDLRVCYLNTPLETCLRQIEQRRQEAGNEKPLNPANTTNRIKVIERSRKKLSEIGVTCREGSAETLYQFITSLIKGT